MLQAIHWASTDSAGSLQAGVQGYLPWAQHGGGAGDWWTLSFCGSGLHEGNTTVDWYRNIDN